jgi:hypothetical protein
LKRPRRGGICNAIRDQNAVRTGAKSTFFTAEEWIGFDDFLEERR